MSAVVDAAAIAAEVARLLQTQAPKRALRTFGAIADDWLLTEAKRLVCPDNERRHLTHLEPLWSLTEETLTPRRVKEHLAALLRPHGTLGAATVNKVRSTGKRVIREAQINSEWLAENPFALTRREKEPRPDHETLTLAEVICVLPVLREDRRREFLFHVYLGPRPGEERALLKEDVDRANRVVTFRRSNGRDTTKTGRTRKVPVPDELWPVLEEALAVSPCDLVFPTADGRQQRHDTKLSRMLRDTLRRAGLVTGWDYVCRRKGCGYRDEQVGAERQERQCPLCRMHLWARGRVKQVRWYDLRHTSATLHRRAGCDPLVVQLALGHSPKSVTDDVYTHLDEDYCRKELNKLSLKLPTPPTHQGGHDGGGNTTSNKEEPMRDGANGSVGDMRPRAWEARALPTELPPQNLAGGVLQRLLTVKQVADTLSVSPAKVYSLLAEGAIPTVWVGDSRRVRPADLAAYVQRGGRP